MARGPVGQCDLHLSGSTEPLSSTDLRALIAERGALWIWVRNLERSQILRENDGLHVRAAECALAIEDASGRPVPRVGGRDAIAFVDLIWRAPRMLPLNIAPWKHALEREGRLAWLALDTVDDVAHRVSWLVDQWTHGPIQPAEARWSQKEIYEAPVGLETVINLGAGELSETEDRLRMRHLRAGGHVLVIGCGAGRECFALARHGFRVTGIDLSRGALDAARARAAEWPKGQLEFHWMAFDQLQFPPESFDAVLIATDLSVPGRENRIAALARCAATVRLGGVVMLPAVISKDSVAVDLPRRLARRFLGPARFTEPGDRWQRLWPDTDAPSFKHRYAREEDVIAEGEAAGLQLIDRVSTYFVFKV